MTIMFYTYECQLIRTTRNKDANALVVQLHIFVLEVPSLLLFQ